MTKASTNTDYHKAKLLIGEKEFNSEEYRIDSIKIQNGCYDGTIVGVGCVYGATANIVMENIDEVSIGQKIEIIFVDQQGKEKSFGKFWVKSYPVQDRDLMTLECHGAIGKDGDTPYYVPGMYQEFSMSIEEATSLISETSDIYVKWDIENPYAFTNRYYIDFPVQEDKFDPTNDANYAANIAPVSKREFLAGIAIKFGGNVVERDGYAYFTPKTPQNEEVFYFDEDSYSDLKISKERYGINSISLKYMPKYVNAEGTRVYRGTDRVTKAMLVSQTSGAGADVLYNQEVECDWVGYDDIPSCFLQGDLSYRTGECVLVGYSDHLYPGNIVGILNNNEIIPFYIGEVTFDWDGGFVTTISCNCRVDVSGGTSSTSTSSSTSSAQINQSAQSAYNKLVFADITLSNIKDSTITGSLIADSTIKGSNIEEGTITGSKIKAATITGALIVDGTIRGNHIMESSIDGSKIEDSAITESKISNSSITNSKIKDGEIENSKIKDATLTGSKIVNSTLTNDLFKDGTIENSKIKDGTIENSKIKDATLTGAKIQDATIGFEKVDTSFIEDLTADKAYIEKLKASIADIGYLTADDADIAYAKIDFSNVGTQVVSSSMIIDGAVTNEKVANLSANKITSGTIDASKITVTNLNADNITVGTINGQRIGNGSLSLDKLAEEVPTKEYLDNVEKNLQGQIDGAIETFTKSEIPTLNNEPASLWTDNETRKKHIGDVCYVLNPASSADGYCYRFANTGTEASPSYEWLLIKDSDVTKALQDIIDINGEITGIKQFDTEISSWKTDTNDELSSLKARTTTLETDIGSKVESSVFNELKQTVDENISNIASLSTTVSKKADSSTVTALTNTVNSVKQTADKNTSSIISMQTEIGKKADGSTVTELSKRTSNLEQNLDGFKTTVSKTYTTKTEFDNLEIGGRNLLLNSSFELTGNPNWIGLSNYAYITKEGRNGGYCAKQIGELNKNNNLTNSVSLKVKANDVFTFSGWYKVQDYVSGTTNNYVRPYIEYHKSNGAWVGETAILNISPDATDWTYVQASFKVPNISTLDYMRFVLYARDFTGIIWWDDIKLEKGNKATDWTPAPEDTEESITEVKTIAEQTADKFNWIVKSGTSSTDFTLTDRVAILLSEQFNIDALTTFKNSAENGTSTVINGGAIKAKTIKASSIDVDNLFAQDITATGTITGATLKGTDAEITNGKIGNFSLSDGNFEFSNKEADLTLGKYGSFGYGNYGLSIYDYTYQLSDYCAIFTAHALRIGKSSKKGGNISFTTLLAGDHITTPAIYTKEIQENNKLLKNLYSVVTTGKVSTTGSGSEWKIISVSFGKTYAVKPFVNVMFTKFIATENIIFSSFIGDSTSGYTGFKYAIRTATSGANYSTIWFAVGNIKS